MEPPDPTSVATLEDFVRFVDELAQHFDRERGGDDWQHLYIGGYLDAMAAYLRGTPQVPEAAEERARELEQERPTWRGVAILLDAARVYE